MEKPKHKEVGCAGTRNVSYRKAIPSIAQVCRASSKLRGLRPIPVDRDNFEEVMARLGVELHLGSGDGTRMAIRIKELDDFRPERIFAQVEVFEKLRDTRKKLSNSGTFAAAASEI